MPRVLTIRSDAGARATFTASSAPSGPAAGTFKSSTQDVFVLPAAPTNGLASSFTANAARRLSNGRQRGLRLQLVPGSRGYARAGRVEPMPGPAIAADPPQAALPEAVAPEPPPPSAPPENGAVDSTILKKYSINIDSLDNFELLRYIPVTIEPLGERVFVAEVSELNLSMTGRTPEDAVRLLKDVITRTYEANRTRRNTLDADRRRQQRILDTYIGKPKGVWHWA